MKLKHILKMHPKELLFLMKLRIFPTLVSSEEYRRYLNWKGVNTGIGTVFFDPAKTIVDTQRPCLLTIGEYCKITTGVTILAHDYSRSVLRLKYRDILGEAAETRIGNNVFIGVKSTILMGSQVGDNVIIGAGSVVSGRIPSNVVVAGNPAKIIRSIEEHYNKRKLRYVDEGKLYVRKFYEKYNRLPMVSEMGAFFPLFLKKDKLELKKNNVWTNWSGDIEGDIIDSFMEMKPVFSNYEEFIKAALGELDK